MRRFSEAEKESMFSVLKPICYVAVIAFYFTLFCSRAFKTGLSDFISFLDMTGLVPFSSGKKGFNINKISIVTAEIFVTLSLAVAFSLLLYFIVVMFYGKEFRLFTGKTATYIDGSEDSSSRLSRAEISIFANMPVLSGGYTGIIKSNN